MDLYLLLKFLHVLGAAILFGTGLGIAFFLYMADRSGDVDAIARTLKTVIVADYLFTATAAIAQPVTGVALVHVAGYSLTDFWIVASLALYVLVGVCWLPVVSIQIRLRNLAAESLRSGENLPPAYRRLMRVWFWLGWPAFLSVVAIYWLMLAKPAEWPLL